MTKKNTAIRNTQAGWLLATALSATVGLLGCGDDGGGTVEPDPTPASLTITPISSDFGGVDIGASSSAVTFAVTNNGEADSTALSALLGGGDAGDFAISADTCSGNTLTGGSACTLDVTFTASAEGSASGSLTVSANSGGSASSTLTGDGNAPGLISISPTPHDFTSLVVGVTSATQAFVLTNTGGSDAGAITAALAGGDAVMYSITANTCGASLAANATCTITADFTPTSAGAKTTSLNVSSGSGGNTSATLNGTGLDDASLAISPDSQDYGTITENNNSVDVTFTVTNSGDVASGSITSALGGTDASDFTLVSDACNGVALAADATCDIVVNFSPATASLGDKVATVDVMGAPGGTISSALSGTSNAAGLIELDPSVGNYGDIVVGVTSNAQTFTVENTGGTPSGNLVVALQGSNPGDFLITDACTGQNLAAAGTCDITISFRPLAQNARLATLRVTSPNAGVTTAALNGTGLGAALLSLTPPSQNFGSVASGSVGAPITFTVENLGDETSSIPAVSIVGTDFAQYTLFANGCTIGLVGGDTCDIQVVFAPIAEGTFSATLEVAAATGGTDTSLLAGTGTEPAALSLDESVGLFGPVVEDDSSTGLDFVLTNLGAQTSGVLTTSKTADDAAEFLITADTCDGNTLAFNASCTVTVTFDPTITTLVDTAKLTELVISGTPGGTVSAALSGTSLPKFTLAPAPFDFGDVDIGDTASRVFTTTNTTSARDFVTAIINDTNGEFSIPGGSNNCTPGTTAIDGTCTFTVVFTPATNQVPGARTATLQVTADGTTQSAGLDGASQGFLVISADQVLTNVSVGSTTTADFIVTNNSGTVSSGPLSTLLTTTGDFEIDSDGCAGLDLAPGAPCTVTVRFYPLTAATQNATLDVTGSFESGAGTVSATLTGTGRDDALLSIAGSGNFNSVIATGSATRSFTVTNDGDVTIAAGNISVDVTGDTAYVPGSVDTCTDAELLPDASCMVEVDFDTVVTAALGAKPGLLTVNSNTGAGSPLVVLTGVVTSQLTIAGNGAFASEVSGDTSTTRNFTITNVSGVATITNVVPSSSNARFTAGNGTCGVTLAAGDNCNVTASFTPNAGNSTDFTGVLTAQTSEAGATAAMNLSGTGLTQATLAIGTPSSQEFGTLAANGLNGITRSFTIANTGEVATTALSTSTPTDFAITANSCTGTLAGDTTCTVTVEFRPLTAGAKDEDITVSAATGGSAIANVTGTAITATTDLVVSPALQDYGSRALDTGASAAVTYTVANPAGGGTSGNLTVVVPTHFALSGVNTCTTLVAGASCTFNLVFNPGAAGIFSSTLVVQDDGGPDIEAQVEGVGLANSLIVSADDLDFGFDDVATGASSTVTLTVANAGEVAHGAITTVLNQTSTVFSVTNNDCAGNALAVNDTCTFDLTFTPTQELVYSGSVDVGPDAGSFSYTFNGRGVDPVALAITPEVAADCGTATAGLDEGFGVECETYTITNVGGLETGNLVVVLSDEDNFEFIASDDCDGSSLSVGETCDIVVYHSPNDVGVLNSATVTVTAPTGANVVGNVSGTGVTALSTPTSGDFGDVAAGEMSGGTDFVITNAVNTPMTGVLTVDIGGADPGEYSYSSTCSGTMLAPGATCTVRVTFVPTSVANGKTATIDISDGNGNKTLTIDLTGDGVNPT